MHGLMTGALAERTGQRNAGACGRLSCGACVLSTPPLSTLQPQLWSASTCHEANRLSTHLWAGHVDRDGGARERRSARRRLDHLPPLGTENSAQ